MSAAAPVLRSSHGTFDFIADTTKTVVIALTAVMCYLLTGSVAMRFNQKRAMAFAEYTLPALVKKEAPKKNKHFIKLTRANFSEILQTQRLRSEHIELVRRSAAEYGIAMANMGSYLVFFDIDDIDPLTPSAEDGHDITDRFEALYGSQAADDVWSSGDYCQKQKDPRLPRRKKTARAAP